jgi:putative FmdB family regulatory protein
MRNGRCIVVTEDDQEQFKDASFGQSRLDFALFFPLLESVLCSVYLPAMPIYEFHCEDCEKDSEVLVRSPEWKGTPCPHCGSTRLAKKLSVFASNAGATDDAPVCTGRPSSCGLCGTGKPHSH